MGDFVNYKIRVKNVGEGTFVIMDSNYPTLSAGLRVDGTMLSEAMTHGASVETIKENNSEQDNKAILKG